ncbi:effector binding domain-containing protein [Rhodococcus sp. NPDC047139]|uniref:GyrI-like domain-containing protein n=1 Tax=Rhodococcus sp. NPDC047139 TaxID=3155141 RepID=UPI0033CF0CF7
MPYEIVDRRETLVAGVPVRSPRRALGKLRDPRLEEAWSALLNGETYGPLAATYTDHAEDIDSYYTQTVGFCCESIEDVPEGYVISRVPAGTYAKFSAVGNRFTDVFDDLWRQIWEAEEEGAIQRAFTGDFETYPHAFGIELYVAIVDPGYGEER